MLLDLLLLLFSAALLISAFLVAKSDNAVHAAFFLILTFLASSGIMLLLECDYFALLFVTVYVGVVAVLFVFVVMTLDTKFNTSVYHSDKYIYLLVFSGTVFLFEILYLISYIFLSNPYNNFELMQNFNINWQMLLDELSEVEVIGQVLYSSYAVQFLVSGEILLVSAMGAVVLLVARKNFFNKYQSSCKQISRCYVV